MIAREGNRQNVVQLQTYGAYANTLVDNAGVIQALGARNHRMAQGLANIISGISAEKIMACDPMSRFFCLRDGISSPNRQGTTVMNFSVLLCKTWLL